ncbi:hypothetical protein BXY82_3145 [Gelidibacter sediminis]|uniref:Lipoprotein n=1 Tax=Gelidibacter sediminis TaxID=1608710 RepID=A0A4R7PJL3_9FLAO|nr:hypothetical protein [Gelidibacter sediminis]TDU33710.1 hypothetical protein BXY82_3145 [Gelidibacter sediminis]
MKIKLYTLILFFLSSCVYNHTAITEDLGNGYFYIGDGHESQILFNKNRKKNESSGLIVTEPEVVEYNYNAKYIIVKSLRENDELFWIIDKEMPIDKVQFMTKNEYKKELRIKGIELELKKRK